MFACFFSSQSASSERSLDKFDASFRGSSQTVDVSGDSPAKHKGKVHVLPLTREGTTEDTKPQPRELPGEKGCSSQMKGKFLSTLMCGSKRSIAQKIDVASRLLFPLSYALYNTGYWYVYLHGIEILT